MPTEKSFKIPSKRQNLFLRVTQGHFATSHSHTNYYIDVTTQKTHALDVYGEIEYIGEFMEKRLELLDSTFLY